MALIDTSVFIGLERRALTLEDLLPIVPDPDEDIAIAAITASELLIGVHRANTPERRARREAFVEALLELVPVLPFDLRAARLHARMHAHLFSLGQKIGAHDLLIAASALATGQPVLTDNIREFNRIPGLTVQSPRWGSILGRGGGPL